MTPDLVSALALLKTYSGLSLKTPSSDPEKEDLRQAIASVCQASNSENLGICADNSTQAFQALTAYLTVLGYGAPAGLDGLEHSETPVYLKYNTQKMSPYLDPYDGIYRGVLIACQGEDEALNGTYGYFPLDLFK